MNHSELITMVERSLDQPLEKMSALLDMVLKDKRCPPGISGMVSKKYVHAKGGKLIYEGIIRGMVMAAFLYEHMDLSIPDPIRRAVDPGFGTWRPGVGYVGGGVPDVGMDNLPIPPEPSEVSLAVEHPL